MIAFLARCGLAAFASLAVTGLARAGDLVPLNALDTRAYENSQNGVVTILCDVPGGDYSVKSRGVVLDLSEQGLDFDVVLTSRHGIVRDHQALPCRLIGIAEESIPVTPVAISMENPQALLDMPYDWAVMRSEVILPAGLPRLRPAHLTQGETGDVSLVMRSFDTEPCRILDAPEGVEDQRLIYHACESRPGLSGAPVVAQIKGHAFVVGIHLGHITMLNEDFREYSVARRLSDDLLDALTNLLETETRR